MANDMKTSNPDTAALLAHHVIEKMTELMQEQPDGRYLSASESWNELLSWLRALAAPQSRTIVNGWPEAVSDGLTLPCADCGEVPRFDYGVTDEFWTTHVPHPDSIGVVCLPCLDRRCGGSGSQRRSPKSNGRATAIPSSVSRCFDIPTKRTDERWPPRRRRHSVVNDVAALATFPPKPAMTVLIVRIDVLYAAPRERHHD